MNFVNDLARQTEEAVGKGDFKDLYSITRTLAGVRKITDRPVRAESGGVLTIKKSREEGGQNTSGHCSIDPAK